MQAFLLKNSIFDKYFSDKNRLIQAYERFYRYNLCTKRSNAGKTRVKQSCFALLSERKKVFCAESRNKERI